MIKIFSVAVILSLTSASIKECSNKRITVVGIATENKKEVTVHAEDGRQYTVEGVYSWDQFYMKRVEVSGKLYMLKIPKHFNDSISRQLTGDTIEYILKRPKWRLAE